jgi:hypothetical protein
MSNDEPKDYLEELFSLREELRWLLNKQLLEELVALAELIDRSYVDAYNRIKDNSENGKNCGYVVKSKDLFLRLQERGISKKIEFIFNTFIKSR